MQPGLRARLGDLRRGSAWDPRLTAPRPLTREEVGESAVSMEPVLGKDEVVHLAVLSTETAKGTAPGNGEGSARPLRE